MDDHTMASPPCLHFKYEGDPHPNCRRCRSYDFTHDPCEICMTLPIATRKAFVPTFKRNDGKNKKRTRPRSASGEEAHFPASSRSSRPPCREAPATEPQPTSPLAVPGTSHRVEPQPTSPEAPESGYARHPGGCTPLTPGRDLPPFDDTFEALQTPPRGLHASPSRRSPRPAAHRSAAAARPFNADARRQRHANASCPSPAAAPLPTINNRIVSLWTAATCSKPPPATLAAPTHNQPPMAALHAHGRQDMLPASPNQTPSSLQLDSTTDEPRRPPSIPGIRRLDKKRDRSPSPSPSSSSDTSSSHARRNAKHKSKRRHRYRGHRHHKKSRRRRYSSPHQDPEDHAAAYQRFLDFERLSRELSRTR